MKTQIVLYVAIIICTVSCNAQQIVPIFNEPFKRPIPYYSKDIDGDYNDYEGTWLWQDGNDSWEITFDKKVWVPDGNSFEDLLIGEYKYIKNGTVLVNSLPIDQNINKYEDHNIYGGAISTLRRTGPPCPECSTDARFIHASLTDPTRSGIYGQIIFSRFIENGIEKMRMRAFTTYNEPAGDPDYTGPLYLTVPDGVYTFVKQ